MMKKILSLLVLATALVSCVGPMGPMGPQGEPGEGVNWKVVDMNIPSDSWELVNDVDQLGSYYMYVFEGNQVPKELEYVVKNYGDLSGYFLSHLDNGDELLSPLPYEVYAGSAEGGNEFTWSELYTFDFTRNSIAFYVYYNDFATSVRPGSMTFRMSLKW